MKTLQNFKVIGISIVVVAGLAACNKPGTSETAGQKIDRAVDTTSQKMDQAGDKAGVVIDDTAITTQVKAAIFAEPGLKTLQIGVDTVKGVVTLTGSVDSPASSDRAKALASAVAGVKGVDNRLALKPIN